MPALLRPLALVLVAAFISSSVHGQQEPVPRRVRVERARDVLRARPQQQLGAVLNHAQGPAFEMTGAQDGMLPIVGWQGDAEDELPLSWDLIESEEDAAEDDVSEGMEAREEERNDRIWGGRRAHLQRRGTPRVKPATSTTSTSSSSGATSTLGATSAAVTSSSPSSSSSSSTQGSISTPFTSAATSSSSSSSASGSSSSAAVASSSTTTAKSGAASSVYTTTTPPSSTTLGGLGGNATLSGLPTATPIPTVLALSGSGTTTRALAATTTTACAARWLAPTMITGTGTLPKPTTFIKRMPTGLGLGLNGESWRIVGTNIHWLCQNEDAVPKGQRTSENRIREALAIAVAMGANTVRIISCSTSVGNAWSIEPKLGSFNKTSLAQVDYAIYAAREYGLRVILPLTDNYNYYHGGKYTFLNWRGVSTANNGREFYTNNLAIASYKSYILNVISRVNSYTGVKYSNDPTILAWETGNELGAHMGAEGYPPLAWTKNIASYIKSLAPSQLVIDGSDGFLSSGGLVAPGVNATDVDIMSDHAYPRNVELITSEIAIAKKYNKGFLIGEWDWRANGGGATLAAYIRKLESHYYLGSLVWSIQGHDEQCCAFVPHNDGYSIYYPNGNTAVDMASILQVVQHFYRVTKRAVPTVLPGVACPQPVF